MKYKILVAHESAPEDFRHEIDIDFIGTEHTEVAQEIVDILNEHELRDCIFKIDEPTAEGSGAPAVQTGNSRYVTALSALRLDNVGNKRRAWNEAIDACIEEIQRLNAAN